jgi:hypothetical protein
MATSEEALLSAGFERVEEKGARPYYRSPVPRVVLTHAKKVDMYLLSQHKLGKLLQIQASMFSFGRAREPEGGPPDSMAAWQPGCHAESG